jgi:hypothetical protein
MPPFSDVHAMRLIEAELGKPVGDLFESIGPRPVAAASLGQVRAGPSQAEATNARTTRGPANPRRLRAAMLVEAAPRSGVPRTREVATWLGSPPLYFVIMILLILFESWVAGVQGAAQGRWGGRAMGRGQGSKTLPRHTPYRRHVWIN